MLKQGGGTIVNAASIAGLLGFTGAPAYVAAKHGVVGLTRTAALEYAQKSIRINCVCPGVIRTPMVERALDSGGLTEAEVIAGEPVGRLGKPEEIAEAVLWLLSDVSVPGQVEMMVDKTVATYGRLGCAFNNAGIEGKMVDTAEYPEEVFDRIIAINLKGVWLCMKYEILHMLKIGGGAIVNTASGAGLVGAAQLSAYNASKHGVVGLTKTAALEFAQLN